MNTKEYKCHQYVALQLFNHLQKECYISELSSINYGKNETNTDKLDKIILNCMSLHNENDNEKQYRISLYDNYINNHCYNNSTK